MHYSPTPFITRIKYLLLLPLLGSQIWLAAAPPQPQESVYSSYLKNNQLDEAEQYLLTFREVVPSYTQEEQRKYFSQLGNLYARKGQHTKTLEFTLQALRLPDQVQDSNTLAQLWKITSVAYNRSGNLDSALYFTKLIYDFATRNNEHSLKMSALQGMGNIAQQNKRFNDALSLFKSALEEAQITRDTDAIAGNYYNIGLALMTLGQHQEAETAYQQALTFNQYTQNNKHRARIYGSLSDLYQILKKYDISIQYLEKANQIARRINDSQLLAMGLSNMVSLNLILGNYPKVLELEKQAREYLKIQPLVQLDAKLDSAMYQALKSLGRTNEALSYFESFSQKKNKILNEQQKRQLNELVLQHEITIKNLTIQNQAIALKSERNAKLTIMALAAFLLSILIFILYLYLKDQKLKATLFQRSQEQDFQLDTLRKRMELEAEKKETYALRIADAADEETQELEGLENKPKELFLQIINLIEKQKLFLEPELDQKFIIKTLGTNRQYLYKAISLHSDASFKGIINNFRIAEAKKMISEALENGQELNFSQLYKLVGFNSSASFYRIFKSSTGLSPSDYAAQFLEAQKKGMPSIHD
ncbi:MAG: tetratricopeptide repeat protein [Chitinophagales bacterium]|jgi:tetratricopeptide (TPR) repeat protein/AraC-like DNA-binding protein